MLVSAQWARAVIRSLSPVERVFFFFLLDTDVK